MDGSLLPILSALAIGLVGFGLMITSFVMMARQGGIQPGLGHHEKWTLPKRLMVTGAGLGALFGIIIFILFLIPGGVPWNK